MRLLAVLALVALACVAVGPSLSVADPSPGSSTYGLHQSAQQSSRPNRPQVRTDLRLSSGRPLAPQSATRLTPSSAAASRTPTSSWGFNRQQPQLQQPGGGYRRLDSGYGSSHGSRSPSLSPQKSPAAPGLFGRRPPTTTAAPAKAAGKAPPCDCNCYSRPLSALCAMDPVSRDKETFINQCQLDCYNCTSKKRYKVIALVACEDHKED
ncbi:uncharacterized protein LOC113210196 [Frankliniella occidentalis]|uniref:Uncharacterized protein LOC113210196 n=1 Tax=Frankliniella occidentalis TaxID=133901 RepID=A0A6J1SSM7_FRAOC|nr:uncharacterized protein LOC113210196 [Frankliniella occidentalis]